VIMFHSANSVQGVYNSDRFRVSEDQGVPPAALLNATTSVSLYLG
jgi:hypothetical protein